MAAMTNNDVFMLFQTMVEEDNKTRPLCPRCGMRMEDGDQPGQFFCIPCTDELAIAEKWEEF